MSTLTIELPDETAARLVDAAKMQGVAVEELLARAADDYLARNAAAGDAAFRKALGDSVRENAELLRRLAQ